jgi:hypothetical protein
MRLVLSAIFTALFFSLPLRAVLGPEARKLSPTEASYPSGHFVIKQFYGRGGEWEEWLYPEKGEPYRLSSDGGVLYTARYRLSPNGRYLLREQKIPNGSGEINRSVYLYKTDGQGRFVSALGRRRLGDEAWKYFQENADLAQDWMPGWHAEVFVRWDEKDRVVLRLSGAEYTEVAVEEPRILEDWLCTFDPETSRFLRTPGQLKADRGRFHRRQTKDSSPTAHPQ